MFAATYPLTEKRYKKSTEAGEISYKGLVLDLKKQGMWKWCVRHAMGYKRTHKGLFRDLRLTCEGHVRQMLEIIWCRALQSSGQVAS